MPVRLPGPLNNPLLLDAATGALDAAGTAWGVRRKPRTSASFLRRSLVMTTLGQGASIAGRLLGQQQFTSGPLVDSQSGFRPPLGEVPLKIGPTWDGDPSVLTVEGHLVVVAGPDFDLLDTKAQDAAYRSALRRHLDPATAAGLALAQGLVRFGAHRAVVGRRERLSRGRTAGLALAIFAGEAVLVLGAKEIAGRRRRTRAMMDRLAYGGSFEE